MKDLNIQWVWGATFSSCWGMRKALLASSPQTPTDNPYLTHQCQLFPHSTSCWALCWTARAYQPGVEKVGMGGRKQHCRSGEEKDKREGRPSHPHTSSESSGLTNSSPGQGLCHADGPGPPHAGPSTFYVETYWGGWQV